jgi:sentrin-specific protease 1
VNGLVCGTSNCFSTVLCSNQVLVLVLTTVETCFIEQLYKDKRSYDYKSVRRWTTQKKIGYSLVKCDKILVPIHQDVHWCLAVINIRDKRIEYLDSLKGADDTVLQVLVS